MCVEVAIRQGGDILVRDSKNDTDDSLILVFSQREWMAFVDALKAGEFDYLIGAFKGFGPSPVAFSEFGPMTPIMAVPLDEPGADLQETLPRRMSYKVC